MQREITTTTTTTTIVTKRENKSTFSGNVVRNFYNYLLLKKYNKYNIFDIIQLDILQGKIAVKFFINSCYTKQSYKTFSLDF